MCSTSCVQVNVQGNTQGLVILQKPFVIRISLINQRCVFAYVSFLTLKWKKTIYCINSQYLSVELSWIDFIWISVLLSVESAGEFSFSLSGHLGASDSGTSFGLEFLLLPFFNFAIIIKRHTLQQKSYKQHCNNVCMFTATLWKSLYALGRAWNIKSIVLKTKSSASTTQNN